MQIIAAIFAAYIVFAVQLGLVPYFLIKSSNPNVILIAIVGLLFARRKTSGYTMAGFGGILLDIFSPFRFGLFTILYFFIALMVEKILKRFVDEANIFSWLGVVAAASALAETPALVATLSLRVFAGNIVYTLLAAILLYALVKFLRPREIIKLP